MNAITGEQWFGIQLKHLSVYVRKASKENCVIKVKSKSHAMEIIQTKYQY